MTIKSVPVTMTTADDAPTGEHTGPAKIIYIIVNINGVGHFYLIIFNDDSYGSDTMLLS